MSGNDFVKYSDLMNVKGADPETDKEKFVCLPENGEYVFGRYMEGEDMAELTSLLPVRKTVYEKLMNVGRKLHALDPNYRLLVTYAFREMRIQQKGFEEVKKYFEEQFEFEDQVALYERAHEKVAVPDVAGHPTGGAVDVAIYDDSKGDILDFGTKIDDLTDLIYYAAEDISDEAKKNRRILREAMLDEGFAPYDGEWWHFCYGDKEWAFYYKKDRALYNQVYSLEDLDMETK